MNIELPQFSVNDLSLSAENILLPYKIWQQNNANISFSADSLVWKDTIINKPIIELTLTNKKATISNLSLDVFNGNIQLSGLLSPTTINLSSLTLNQIKWLISPQELDSISNYLTQLEQVNIANLDINNSQIIQLETAHPFQLSGLNVEGHDLDLLRYYQWALWDGKLSISASNASLNYLLTQQLLIETNTNNGRWTIERALFPLTEGLIGLNGSINLKQDSQPWQLEAYGDGIPLSDLAKWLPNPIPLEGMAEFTFSGNGLAVNKDSFNYSFDGDLNVIPRETTTETAKDLWQLKLGLIPEESQSEKDVSAQTQRKKEHTMDKKTIYPINIEPIHISANRGRISINPIMITGDGFNYNVEGEYDLVNPEKAETVISLTQECHQIVQRLFSDKVDLINYCQ